MYQRKKQKVGPPSLPSRISAAVGGWTKSNSNSHNGSHAELNTVQRDARRTSAAGSPFSEAGALSGMDIQSPVDDTIVVDHEDMDVDPLDRSVNPVELHRQLCTLQSKEDLYDTEKPAQTNTAADDSIVTASYERDHTFEDAMDAASSASRIFSEQLNSVAEGPTLLNQNMSRSLSDSSLPTSRRASMTADMLSMLSMVAGRDNAAMIRSSRRGSIIPAPTPLQGLGHTAPQSDATLVSQSRVSSKANVEESGQTFKVPQGYFPMLIPAHVPRNAEMLVNLVNIGAIFPPLASKVPSVDEKPIKSGDNSNTSSEPALYKQSTTKPKKAPRPPNSFIIYRTEKQDEVLRLHEGITNNEVSRVIGKMWAEEPQAVKDEYKGKAEEAKRLHTMAFPDYKYTPRKTTKPGKKGAAGLSTHAQSGEKGKSGSGRKRSNSEEADDRRPSNASVSSAARSHRHMSIPDSRHSSVAHLDVQSRSSKTSPSPSLHSVSRRSVSFLPQDGLPYGHHMPPPPPRAFSFGGNGGRGSMSGSLPSNASGMDVNGSPNNPSYNNWVPQRPGETPGAYSYHPYTHAPYGHPAALPPPAPHQAPAGATHYSYMGHYSGQQYPYPGGPPPQTATPQVQSPQPPPHPLQQVVQPVQQSQQGQPGQVAQSSLNSQQQDMSGMQGSHQGRVAGHGQPPSHSSYANNHSYPAPYGLTPQQYPPRGPPYPGYPYHGH